MLLSFGLICFLSFIMDGQLLIAKQSFQEFLSKQIQEGLEMLDRVTACQCEYLGGGQCVCDQDKGASKLEHDIEHNTEGHAFGLHNGLDNTGKKIRPFLVSLVSTSQYYNCKRNLSPFAHSFIFQHSLHGSTSWIARKARYVLIMALTLFIYTCSPVDCTMVRLLIASYIMAHCGQSVLIYRSHRDS